MEKVTQSKNEFNIGARIRLLREEARLSLRGLADLCDLSFNAINRIERGENSPTVATLHKLAAALNVSIADFFIQSPSQMAIFTSAGSELSLDSEGVVIKSLASGFSNQQLQVFRLDVGPFSTTLPTPVSHSGEEFVFCLDGQITYHVGSLSFDLDKGDSLLFKATQPHAWENKTDRMVSILVVFQSVPDAPSLWQQHAAQ